MIAKFEASLADRVKDEVRKEFHSCLWSWSLPIQKRVVWPVKRHFRERRWHSKVEVEDCGSKLQLYRACRWINGCKDGRLILLRHDHREFGL